MVGLKRSVEAKARKLELLDAQQALHPPARAAQQVRAVLPRARGEARRLLRSGSGWVIGLGL